MHLTGKVPVIMTHEMSMRNSTNKPVTALPAVGELGLWGSWSPALATEKKSLWEAGESKSKGNSKGNRNGNRKRQKQVLRLR